MRARFCLAVVLAIAVSSMAGSSALAESPEPSGETGRVELSATLEGEPISPSAIAALPCHDFEYPILRCFSSVPRLLDAIGSSEAGTSAAGSSAVAATGYVIAYDYFSYAGSNPKVLSSDQSWLALIGWNDTTSSFKSYGATGRWWENSPSGGILYSFGPTTAVPFLSSSYDNMFSAFDID